MPKGLFSSGGIWKPKNPHSLEYLKYLYGVLTKNAIVTEQNRSLLVETLRLISEILIWGDQNDSSVFDFFLEKNMLAFFLFIMRQKCGRYVCLQLLQTLNILFENIKNETSLYYLLSNNHVNSIITHRFDFSNEEILAYYISFLKTLSFKLNANTVHFFFNEHNNDFPLYTEAIKFFNHTESMVRIAVRTLTLNVYKVNDAQVLQFIRDRTAVPYFANLVWFIRQQAGEINSLVDNATWASLSRLQMLIADHQDHVHYLNDILCLNVEDLNQVLINQIMSKLFLPVYLNSLYSNQNDKGYQEGTFSLMVTLFLLTQIFIIVTQSKLVEAMARILLLGSNVQQSDEGKMASVANDVGSAPAVDLTPSHPLEEEEETNCSVPGNFASLLSEGLQCTENDRVGYFLLCLLLSIGENEGVSPAVIECTQIAGPADQSDDTPNYVTMMLRLISRATKEDVRIRVPTVRLCCAFLKHLNLTSSRNAKMIKQSLDELCALQVDLRHKLAPYADKLDTFIELFEEELTQLKRNPVQMSAFASDALYLLPAVALPATVDFLYRSICTDVERVKKLLTMYLVLTQLIADIQGKDNPVFTAADATTGVKLGDCINLSNSDLLACSVVQPDGSRCQQFLVVGGDQLMFVEPDSCKVGWGVVRLEAGLEKCEVRSENDNRALQLVIHSVRSKLDTSKSPTFTAKLAFSDHIRCLAAHQRLVKGCDQNRKCRLSTIRRLLEIPVTNASSQPGTCGKVIATSGSSPGEVVQNLPGFAVKHLNSAQGEWTVRLGHDPEFVFSKGREGMIYPNKAFNFRVRSPSTGSLSAQNCVEMSESISSTERTNDSLFPCKSLAAERCRSVSPRLSRSEVVWAPFGEKAASVEETKCVDVDLSIAGMNLLRSKRNGRLAKETEVALACEERKS